MTGRGIDQVLPHPSDPTLHEPWVRSAADYVMLAEQAHGPIAGPVDFAYVWGDALAELTQVPDLRIVNLETSITRSNDYWRGKGIHYRMHPDNVPCLTAARIDCCVLANNHVMDWGYRGLEETLDSLDHAAVKRAGAGRTAAEAQAPAVIDLGAKGRVLVFAYGAESSGIPPDWAAAADRPGVNLLPDLSERTARHIGERISAVKRPGDIAVVSLHWGGNWGYPVPRHQAAFAHFLIEAAGADVIHGHSSHHAKGVEVYKDRPIIYGCGDLLNDYEGIGGHETLRNDLAVMYFLGMSPSGGRLRSLEMVPKRIERFRLNRVSPEDASWLGAVFNREGLPFATRVRIAGDRSLHLEWGGEDGRRRPGAAFLRSNLCDR